MNAEREKLAAVVNGADWTSRSQSIAETVLAAGYRKPRTIATAEELDALPVESVVRSGMGVVWEKDVDIDEPDLPWWCTPSDSRRYPTQRISFPATVLHEPEASK